MLPEEAYHKECFDEFTQLFKATPDYIYEHDGTVTFRFFQSLNPQYKPDFDAIVLSESDREFLQGCGIGEPEKSDAEKFAEERLVLARRIAKHQAPGHPSEVLDQACSRANDGAANQWHHFVDVDLKLYDQFYVTDLNFQFGEIDIYWFDQLLRRRITAGMRILDAGCVLAVTSSISSGRAL
jgi:hypothetical protein